MLSNQKAPVQLIRTSLTSCCSSSTLFSECEAPKNAFAATVLGTVRALYDHYEEIKYSCVDGQIKDKVARCKDSAFQPPIDC